MERTVDHDMFVRKMTWRDRRRPVKINAISSRNLAFSNTTSSTEEVYCYRDERIHHSLCQASLGSTLATWVNSTSQIKFQFHFSAKFVQNNYSVRAHKSVMHVHTIVAPCTSIWLYLQRLALIAILIYLNFRYFFRGGGGYWPTV